MKLEINQKRKGRKIMEFIEINKTAINLPRYDVDAVYRIGAKTGEGVVRFTRKGITFLEVNIKDLDLSKAFKIFIGKDNLTLAFKYDENGEFHIRTDKHKKQYSDPQCLDKNPANLR